MVHRITAHLTAFMLTGALVAGFAIAGSSNQVVASFASSAGAATPNDCSYANPAARDACLDSRHSDDPQRVCAYKNPDARKACLRSHFGTPPNVACAYKNPAARDACIDSRSGDPKNICKYKNAVARENCLRSKRL